MQGLTRRTTKLDEKMKIVESGYKLDLHIHSCFSKTKDGSKVAFNTIDNIEVLVEKLSENGVQLCAITDHDAFNFDIYKALKSYEKYPDTSIAKVFPGVEFTVEFIGDSAPAAVHVIAIFDDADDEKIKNISNALNNESGQPDYDKSHAFSEEKFLSILRTIDIDTILIAHQKNSMGSVNTRKDDAKSVGPDKFNELVRTDYFEAFEFKNKRNEIFNKAYLFEKGLEDDIRFITGSDCHDWRVYPKETESDKSEFVYSFVKCLPTFKGLVMAITDHRRIKTVNSFFSASEAYLPQIKMSVSGKSFNIPLSRGINVIIGDNSIGKSLLLHKLTDFNKIQEVKIKNGYKQYLTNNNIVIESKIDSEQLFGFDMQGEVREKFELKTISSDTFLKNYYPRAIDPSKYREIIQRELDKVYDYLKEKFEIDELISNLWNFKLEDFQDYCPESLSFSGEVLIDDQAKKDLKKIIDSVERIIEELSTISENELLSKRDKEILDGVKNQLNNFKKPFSERHEKVIRQNKIINIFNTVVTKFKEKYSKTTTDSQKKYSAYNENLDKAAQTIAEIVLRKNANFVPKIDFDPVDVEISYNSVYNYNFNSKLGVLKIDASYIWDLFKRSFKKTATKSVLEMTQSDLAEALPRFDEQENDSLSALKKSISSLVDNDLKPVFTITEQGKDRTEELSAGFNSKTYFDLLSYDTTKIGMYIIDQPEDNISQRSIKDFLLERFKTMGENRQVIIVTHNPQFIVNLDVDNVIFLGKDSEGNFIVQSGALEYQDDEYSMLNIISSHIEGGLDTLKRRWKRYEKNDTLLHKR